MESPTISANLDIDRQYGVQEVQDAVFRVDSSEPVMDAVSPTRKTLEVTVEIVTEQQCLEVCHTDDLKSLPEVPVQILACDVGDGMSVGQVEGGTTLIVLGVPHYPHGFRLVLGTNTYYTTET
ncbi:hypothetical protein EON63_15245 [archaeon]|nr:MAG: hypothetical protein EON63_15245 [archaeon]